MEIENTLNNLVALTKTENSEKAIEFTLFKLLKLIGFKKAAEHLVGLNKILRVPFPKVTVSSLLEMLFDVVQSEMLKGVAPAISEKVPQAAATADAASLHSTAQMDETIEEGLEATDGLGYSVTVAIS